jgi:hypothetical protein
MAYWWQVGSNHYIGNPDAWWPGAEYTDFTAVDTYTATPKPLSQDPKFMGWYKYMQPKGKPMYITEYGRYAVPAGRAPDPAMQALRAQVMAQDAEWLRQQGTISMWLLWHAGGAQGDWRLQDAASQTVWRDIAEGGRTS